MNPSDLLEVIKDDLSQVEVEIQKHLQTDIPLLNELSAYILDSGGKRLRPAILILAGRMFNCTGSSIHVAAAAVEFLHTATLLHDDVVDDADTRRGRPAARKVWGNPASVLVGDYLLATSFRSLTHLQDHDVLDTISHTTALMAKGEILQLLRRIDTATEEDYMAIILHKTACLFGAAARIGGALGGADDTQRKALYDYGNDLGIAFQIVDDALDYEPEREKVGKPLGIDLKEKKVTLPLSRLLKVAQGDDLQQLTEVVGHEEITDADVALVVEMMGRYDVLPYTLGEAARFARQAGEALAALPDTPERAMLASICDIVVERKY